MDSRKLAALLSSLVSELLLLVLLLFPSSTPLSLTSNSNSNSNSHFNSYENIFPLIHHFLFSQEIAASLSLLAISRKRKRTHLSEAESESTDEDRDQELGARLGDTRVELGLTLNPDSFRNCFKMTTSTFEWLSGLLEPLLECRDPVGSPLNLSAEIRLGIGLFRLATGSCYREIASRFGVSESVTRFCAKQLCRVLCTNFRFWVAFPSPEELKSVSTSFEELTGLPNCCGIVDCTRFKIVKHDVCKLSIDKVEEEDSIAAQIVVDSSSRILSIVAGFRGNKGNSRVLKSSTLYKDIEGGRLLNSRPVCVDGVAINQYLVGDAGYPLLPWLMAPFVDRVSVSSEENFNAATNLMRIPALKTIASLKNWGVLNKPIREEFKTAVAFIGACSILHNVLLMREDDSAFCEVLGDYSFHDQCSHYYRDATLEENSIEREASIIRSALATRAREFHNSKYGRDPSGSGQLQSN